MEPREDPVVEEVREPRRRASLACGHDPARLVEYYMRLQERYKDRLLGSGEKVGQPVPAARPGQDAA